MSKLVFDLVIGIDFGTSGVGVAYHQPDGTDPPPNEDDAKDNAVTCLTWGSGAIQKVPAKLGYPVTYEQEPTSWGLQVPMRSTSIHIQEWFKIKFGEENSHQTGVEKIFRDYLTLLHTELSTRFARDVLRDKRWADANVSFYFSTPCIWNPASVGRFRELVEAAGFGRAPNAVNGHGLHTVDISLLEPQATAALHLRSKDSPVQFKSGQCVIVVDAGAGTAVHTTPARAIGFMADWFQDFCLLKVSHDERELSKLDEKVPAGGGKIGSAYIDQDLQTRIAEVLRPHRHALTCDVDEVARIMRCSERFQAAKHSFGTPLSPDNIPVPHLKDTSSSLGDRIQSGTLIGIQKDLQAAFDRQLDRIQSRVQYLAGWREDMAVDYLLLSGGLGNSPYIQEKLRAFCRHHKKLKDTEVVASHEPIMAVSMGLVYDAMSNGKLLAEICCPTSFGLVFRMPKDISIRSRWRSKWQELKRRGLFPKQDSLATGVDWFIREGTKKANGEEITQRYTTSFLKEEKTRICEVEIVLSSTRDPSPVAKDHTQRRILMQVDLSDSYPIKEYVTWRDKSYVTIPFWVKATIRPAVVNFRCVDSDGRKVSEWVRFPAGGGQSTRPLLMGLDENDENDENVQ